MSRSTKRFFGTVLLIAIVGVAVWAFLRAKDRGKLDDEQTKPAGPVVRGPATRRQPPTATRQSDTQPVQQPLGAAQAMESYNRGLALKQADKLIEARTLLSRAMFSGHLTAEKSAEALKILTELAEKTILSRRVYAGDPYCFHYTFKAGEMLSRVERKLKLHVPYKLILKINGIDSAPTIQAGQRVKLISGPFHAVVSKSAFTMDLYLHRKGLVKTFIRRLRIGLGKNNSTPTGLWRVALGKKLIRAPWNPPPNSEFRGTILWSEPGYPLGKAGYWIGLEGADKQTKEMTGYGIHGTDSPESIGKAVSLGCIRLGDDDIELVFSMLYEKWSTVEIRP